MFNGPRFFSQQSLLGGMVTLTKEDSKHTVAVLRHKEGDFVTVCDNEGQEAACRIKEISSGAVTCEVIEVRKSPGEPVTPVHLYPSLSKGDRFEWMLQKSVELGVVSITPVISERCVVRSADENKLQRWRRIIMEAAKQSGRGKVPLLNSPVNFGGAVMQSGQNMHSKLGIVKKLFCFEEETTLSLQNALSCDNIVQVSVLTGPEGGYTLKEAERAVENSWQSVSLGHRILRCETAPLAVLAAVQYCARLPEAMQ